jgi:hypothetical protein
MINRYRPHVLLLPEDDANSQLANGFVLDLDYSALSRIQVLPEVGGWLAVLDTFVTDHVAEMDRFPERYLVLLIDFDGEQERLNYAKNRIPSRLRDRVFIVGAWTDPEALKRAGLGSSETIGRAIAKDCREETDITWGHDLLRHNADEINRLRQHVRPILFQHV